MRNYRIRAFEPHDLKAIKEIDRVSFSSEQQYPDELYDSLLTDGPLRAAVAESAGALAGYALLDIKTQPVRIRSIAVVPGHRNKGCGSALLLDLMEQYDALELLVEKGNTAAIRLYERLGFVRLERDENSELGPTHHMFRRFKNASCLNEPPPPNRAATSRADGTI
jgi:ribosomal protein S18 acetylase RimI-like enzyme